jgi:DNA processing protein
VDLDDDRTARVVWSRIAEPGDAEAGRLVAERGAGPALRALVEGRVDVPRWRVRLPGADPARDVAVAVKLGGTVAVPGDAAWPSALDDLGPRRPFCLWLRGTVSPGRVEPAVAIVGARAGTPYGESVAAELAAGCCDAGLAVVSGGAYGIDGAAHRGALAAGGVTVAVLAGGVDRLYPRGNERLLREITDRGLVVSEAPPGSAPTRWRFLERNRLIAALADVTVVVEAAWRSGALRTANEAVDLGRSVAAVPGPVTSPTSAGCHRLLRLGATCVTDAAEVVDLGAAMGAGLAPEPATPTAVHDGLAAPDLRVLDALPLHHPAPVASLAVVAGIDEATVRAALGRLELAGLARERAGRWLRRHRAR